MLGLVGNDVCSFEGCTKPVYNVALCLCSGHYAQQNRGEALRPLRVRLTKYERELLASAEGRTCTTCGEWKTWEHFVRKPSGPNGYMTRCKPCHSAAVTMQRTKL